jgi:Domain of unknown function (DUF4252)
MTKMTKAMQAGLVLAAMVGLTATAQSAAISSVTTVPGANLQAAVAMNVAQVKDDLFAGAEKFAQGASEVTEINLDPNTMSMVRGEGGVYLNGGSPSTRRMNFIVIHSYKYDKPGMYNMDEFEAYSKKLTDGTWNCSIHVRSKTSSTDICSRPAADHESNEMVILTAEPRELTFIHMSGKMSLNELSGMSRDATRLEPRPNPEPFPKLRLVVPDSPIPPTPPASPAPPSH